MAKLYLQRHTEPLIPKGICYGFSDIALVDEYRKRDLPKVLEALGGFSFSTIYSSPLYRCKRLATDIAQERGIKSVLFDDRLKEMNFGRWEMTPWDDIYQREQGKRWFADYINQKTDGGESFSDLLERAESFLDMVRQKDEETLVVTHSGFISAMMVATKEVKLDRIFDYKICYGAVIELSL